MQTSLEGAWGAPVVGGLMLSSAARTQLSRLPPGGAVPRELCDALIDGFTPLVEHRFLEGVAARDTLPTASILPAIEKRVSPQTAPTIAMAYDEDLANRVRELIGVEPDLSERKMFGGLAFLIGGNMSVSVSGQGGLLLRCDPAETDELLAKPAAARFEMRGRQMDGWLRVEADGVRTKAQLRRWVAVGVAYARSLPAKR